MTQLNTPDAERYGHGQRNAPKIDVGYKLKIGDKEMSVGYHPITVTHNACYNL